MLLPTVAAGCYEVDSSRFGNAAFSKATAVRPILWHEATMPDNSRMSFRSFSRMYCKSRLKPLPQRYLSHKGTRPTKVPVPLRYLSHKGTCPTKVPVPQRYLSHKGTCPTKVPVPLRYLSHKGTCPTEVPLQWSLVCDRRNQSGAIPTSRSTVRQPLGRRPPRSARSP